MKVLILSCNTGEGHNSAAHAVCEEFRRRGIDCEVVDSLGVTGTHSSQVLSSAYGSMITHAPHAFGTIYRVGELYNSTGITSPVYYANAAHAKRLLAFITEGGYDCVVATHLFPMEAMTRLKKTGSLPVKCYGVLTDYTRIPFWNETDMDAYFLPHESVKADCIQSGMPADRLYVTGLPVSARFSSQMTKAEARQALSMDERKKTILIMTGGVGCGNAPQLCAELQKGANTDTVIYVLTARNAELKAKLEETYRADGRVVAVPFTDKVHLYMRAADVLITKAGGITTTEAAASRVPLIHAAPIPGCETKNAALFESLGMSMWAKNEAEAAKDAFLLLGDPERAERMTAAQAANIDAHGAENIVDWVMKL